MIGRQLFLRTLPPVPVGDMCEGFLCSVYCDELAKLGELISCSAGVTRQMGAAAEHLPLLAAYGAFVEESFKTVGSEGLGDLYAVFLLPLEGVEGKLPVDDRLYLFG